MAKPKKAPPRRRLSWRIAGLVLLLAASAGLAWYSYHWTGNVTLTQPEVNATPKEPVGSGQILKIISVDHYTAEQSLALAQQNYGKAFSGQNYGVTQVLLTYASTGEGNQPITVYARAYIPDTANAPVFAMAPGTTGIGDECAASLEQPQLHSWANYESDMMAMAQKGFASIITDYEGMRDPDRIHHYMIGQLEGQAVLDSIRAMKQLPQARGIIDPTHVFVAGYSQGGQSAFYADKLNASYAPDVKLSGVIGWAPVMSVYQTWADIENGATLDWFGPYVLTSYHDYYHTNFQVNNILLPQFADHLVPDVLSHCIDSDPAFWGSVPSKVYTEQFLKDLKAGNLPTSHYGALQADMNKNEVGADPTPTPKLINQGQLDTIVLPAQAQTATTKLCASSQGPVKLALYPKAIHYTVIGYSLNDTVAWMNDIVKGTPQPSTCPA